MNNELNWICTTFSQHRFVASGFSLVFRDQFTDEDGQDLSKDLLSDLVTGTREARDQRCGWVVKKNNICKICKQIKKCIYNIYIIYENWFSQISMAWLVFGEVIFTNSELPKWSESITIPRPFQQCFSPGRSELNSAMSTAKTNGSFERQVQVSVPPNWRRRDWARIHGG